MFFDLLPKQNCIGAHRGARSLAPENTILAAATARNCRAHYWELDARLSADGQLVVFHDETLERTTDVAQRPEFAPRSPWNTQGFTLEELQRLDAGSWFPDADPYGCIAAGELSSAAMQDIPGLRIPTLEDALLYTHRHAFPMNLEIKDHSGRPGHDAIVEKVLNLVRKTQTQDLVLLSSFNHEYMAQAKALAPHIPRAALFETPHEGELIPYLENLGVIAAHPLYKIIDREQIQNLLAAGFWVNVWTVNQLSTARELFQWGASSIITDYPQRMSV